METLKYGKMKVILFFIYNEMEKKYDISKECIKLSMMIIKLYKFINERNEFVLSKQILRSWTSIGANVMEAQDAQSKKDFLSKMNIALKESKETQYRLLLINESWYLEKFDEYKILNNKLNEIVWVLTKIVITTKNNLWIN